MGNVVAESIVVRASIAVTVTVEEPTSVTVGETVSIAALTVIVPVTTCDVVAPEIVTV